MTATKHKSMIFDGKSVRAILDWRKSQTRRVVKPQPPRDSAPYGTDRLRRCGGGGQ